jgi:predicted PurR-regulated permease PerM
MDTRPADLPRTTLQLISLGLLIASTLWIMSPFLPAMMWAATIVVATWPILLRIESVVGGRRGPAVAVLTGALLLLLVVPLFFAIDAIVGNTDLVVNWATSLATASVSQPPDWVASLPIVGSRIAERWRQAASMSPEQLAATVVPYAQGAALWIVQQIGSLGLLVVQFLLTIVICALLYANGESAAGAADRIAARLAGQQGHNAIVLAGQAVRGVALGVVVTALLQTALIAAGMTVAGVPYASILVAATFVLCVAQIGPIPILVPSVIWVWSAMGTGWGTAFLIWSVLCGLLDNVVRPVLIRRGADLPLVLIFTGVIGGLFAMGVIGLFVGPVVLAVAYTLLFDWVDAGATTGSLDAADTRTTP